MIAHRSFHFSIARCAIDRIPALRLPIPDDEPSFFHFLTVAPYARFPSDFLTPKARRLRRGFYSRYNSFMPTPFKVLGHVLEQAIELRWKPVKGVVQYVIQWLDKSRQWQCLAWIEDEDIQPNGEGWITYVDSFTGPIKGGTFRVLATRERDFIEDAQASNTVRLTPSKPKRSEHTAFLKQVRALKTSKPVKDLISKLKWTVHGWRLLIPAETGKLLNKRIEVEVRSEQLSNDILAVLTAIFANLPKLLARAEKAWADYGGEGTLDEEDRLATPRIIVTGSKEWSLIIEIKNSDYGWHIEFVGTRFKTIWAGD